MNSVKYDSVRKLNSRTRKAFLQIKGRKTSDLPDWLKSAVICVTKRGVKDRWAKVLCSTTTPSITTRSIKVPVVLQYLKAHEKNVPRASV